MSSTVEVYEKTNEFTITINIHNSLITISKSSEDFLCTIDILH